MNESFNDGSGVSQAAKPSGVPLGYGRNNTGSGLEGAGASSAAAVALGASTFLVVDVAGVGSMGIEWLLKI